MKHFSSFLKSFQLPEIVSDLRMGLYGNSREAEAAGHNFLKNECLEKFGKHYGKQPWQSSFRVKLQVSLVYMKLF